MTQDLPLMTISTMLLSVIFIMLLLCYMYCIMLNDMLRDA